MSHLGKVMTTIVLFCFSLACNGQDYLAQYKNKLASHDTTDMSNLLHQWEAAQPNNAELIIARYNYYGHRGMKEFSQSLKINDSANQAQAAAVAKDYDFAKAFTYIDKGIQLFPNRLDMRFGKIYLLGFAHRYTDFTEELKKTIDYNAKIKTKWMWQDNKPLDTAEKFFLGAMQDYVMTLYNSGSEQIPLMRQVAEQLLKYYPKHVESLSNIAITYIITEEYDKALTYLLQAEKMKPKDVVILNNIAEAYLRKNDKIHAAIYYQKMIKEGNKDDQEYAAEKLKSLN